VSPELRSVAPSFDLAGLPRRRGPIGRSFQSESMTHLSTWRCCQCGERYLGHGQVKVEPEKLRTFLLRRFAAMNVLFRAHDFPDSELVVMSNGVLSVIVEAGFAGWSEVHWTRQSPGHASRRRVAEQSSEHATTVAKVPRTTSIRVNPPHRPAHPEHSKSRIMPARCVPPGAV